MRRATLTPLTHTHTHTHTHSLKYIIINVHSLHIYLLTLYYCVSRSSLSAFKYLRTVKPYIRMPVVILRRVPGKVHRYNGLVRVYLFGLDKAKSSVLNKRLACRCVFSFIGGISIKHLRFTLRRVELAGLRIKEK